MAASHEALVAALAPYLLIFSAFALPLLGIAKAPKHVARILASAVQGIIFALTLFVLGEVWDGSIITYTFAAFPPPVGITYVVDFLSAFMAVVVAALFLLISPLSGHFVRDNEYFYAAMLGLEAGMLGILFTGDIFNMFVMMEVTLISAYALVSSPQSRGSIKAAFKYAMVGTAAGMIFFLAAVMYYNALGTLNLGQGGAIIEGIMPNLGRAVNPGEAVGFVLNIALWALLAEAALVPLHFWLPDAYSKAPPTIGALMAALSEGISFYIIIRLFYIVLGSLTQEAFVTLASLGLLSIVIGGFGMLYSKDIMRVLAYSTVLDVGYMALALSFGQYGVYIALAYVLAHAIVKPALFLSAGWIAHSAGSGDLDVLKGAFRGNSALMAAFVVGAAAVVGIPPTLLFQAKFQLYQVALTFSYVQALPYQAIIFLVMLLGSALSLAGFLRVIYASYLAPGKPVGKAPTYLRTLVIGFAVATIAMGVLYTYVFGYLVAPAGSSVTFGREAYIQNVLFLLGGAG